MDKKKHGGYVKRSWCTIWSGSHSSLHVTVQLLKWDVSMVMHEKNKGEFALVGIMVYLFNSMTTSFHWHLYLSAWLFEVPPIIKLRFDFLLLKWSRTYKSNMRKVNTIIRNFLFIKLPGIILADHMTVWNFPLRNIE